MKALSVRQPWAWMILHAGKDIENRDWITRYRGRILIHAAKGMTRAEYDRAIFQATYILGAFEFPLYKDLPRGGIVGSVEIVDCVAVSASPWFGGRFGLVLRNPQPLPFRPLKGELGLFEVEEVTA